MKFTSLRTIAFFISVLSFAPACFAGSRSASGSVGKAPVEKKTAAADAIWVMKPDGAESCSADSGIPVEDGANDLKKAKIEVFASQKGDDGQMHAQMCGLPTGKLNLYKIKKSDLAKAQAIGYKKASEEP